MPFKTQAYVARGPDANDPARPLLQLEDVELDDLALNEVLVEIVAVGICQTDIKAALGKFKQRPPMIPGHEGSGYVRAVGSSVSYVQPGDAVVLSYSSCMRCKYCSTGQNAYCDNIAELNFEGVRPYDRSPAAQDRNGQGLNALFFGQSSMARHALVHESSCVKVNASRRELQMFAPLGCGVQTGAGAVINVCKPPPGSTFLIFGAGAVGISAVLAAWMFSPKHVILVDKEQSKLDHRAAMLATNKLVLKKISHEETLKEDVLEITKYKGVDFAIDAVGSGDLLGIAHQLLKQRGMLVTIGAPSEHQTPKIDIKDMLQNGTTYRGTHQGDAVPRQFIPYMIDLWREGKFPFDKMLQSYDFHDIDTPLEELKSAKVIKAVLQT